MEMTDKEICRSYREAKNKNEQILILADLNLCTPQEILNILSQAGEISGVDPRKLQRFAPATKREHRSMTPETIKEMIKLFEQGCTNSEVAEKLGLDNICVSKKKYELKKRGMLFDAGTKAELTKAAASEVDKVVPRSTKSSEKKQAIPPVVPKRPAEGIANSDNQLILPGLGSIDIGSILDIKMSLVDARGERWNIMIVKEG